MYENGIRCQLFHVFCAVCAIATMPVGIGLDAHAQTASSGLTFEVATIKPVEASHPFDSKHFWAHVDPAGASYWYMTVEDLVAYAYDVPPLQVTGPEVSHAERFDIAAKFPEAAHKEEDRKMLQALLKDRFKLAFHIEKKELEGYALAVGKKGDKLKPSPSNPVSPASDAAPKPADNAVEAGQAKSKIIKNADGSSTLDLDQRGTVKMKFDPESHIVHYEYSKLSMGELSAKLGVCFGGPMRTVEDDTRLRGNFQVTFDCPLGVPRMPAGSDAADTLASDPQDASSLSRSLDALGLKLEKRKTLRDVYVIDHVEKPSEN